MHSISFIPHCILTNYEISIAAYSLTLLKRQKQNVWRKMLGVKCSVQKKYTHGQEKKVATNTKRNLTKKREAKTSERLFQIEFFYNANMRWNLRHPDHYVLSSNVTVCCFFFVHSSKNWQPEHHHIGALREIVPIDKNRSRNIPLKKIDHCDNFVTLCVAALIDCCYIGIYNRTLVCCVHSIDRSMWEASRIDPVSVLCDVIRLSLSLIIYININHLDKMT